ncbi:MAG: hypothetical protein K1X28_00810 [Parachlamydiales bacterium]|nr:hypothetical protein [Parachlamydiales bacterium]
MTTQATERLRGVHFTSDDELEVVPPEQDPAAKLVVQAATPALQETPHNNTPADSPKHAGQVRQRVHFETLREETTSGTASPSARKAASCWQSCMACLTRFCRK